MPPTATASAAGPLVDADGVTFRLPDPHHRLAGLRLAQDVRIPGDRLDFAWHRGAWSLRIARPDVDRMEYLLELEAPDGGRSTITDPGNPRRVPGAFGDKSVVEFPEYVAPAWLTAAVAPATTSDVAVHSAALGSRVGGQLWAPDVLAPETTAPLLVVHDGPEFASLGGFLGWAAAMVAAGTVPPLRVALLEPSDRNRWYAVNPAYARALTDDVVPHLLEHAPTSVCVGVGASLGALAMLHAHRGRPGTFDALFLQSGSFFTPTLDPQERRFSRYRPVTRFVVELGQAVTDPAPVPTVLTCGGLEENLANNRLMCGTLQRLGYPSHLVELRDVHTFTAWRDALDPHLTGLVRAVCG